MGRKQVFSQNLVVVQADRSDKTVSIMFRSRENRRALIRMGNFRRGSFNYRLYAPKTDPEGTRYWGSVEDATQTNHMLLFICLACMNDNTKFETKSDEVSRGMLYDLVTGRNVPAFLRQD